MLTIAIQAGGQSRRMGTDKAMVLLGGKPLIEHVLERVEGLGNEILITSNNHENLSYLEIPLIRDTIPGAGALMGLYTALRAAQGTRVLVLACDMPFVNRQLLEYMIAFDPHADVVVPTHDGFFEPLHAIYSKGCLPAIEAALENRQSQVISFYDQVHLRTLNEKELRRFKPEGRSFFNINTPDDLILAEKYLQQTDHKET
jgi:molybdopterin-guanine dinucleotide biosynthesis protein A